MYLYIILIFLIGWSIHPIIERKYNPKTANVIFLLLMCPVCVFAMGLRDSSVGVDTVSYKSFFEDYVYYNWDKVIHDQDTGQGNAVEPGLKILMKLCAEVYPNYFFYQLVFSVLYVGLFIKFIYKYTSNVVLSFAFFLGSGLFMQTFNIARQMFAGAILAYSIVYVIEKKYIKSLIIIGIAYLFHKSSLIMLVMFMVYPLRNKKFIMNLAPLGMLILIVSVERILLPLLLNSVGDKYLMYALNDFSRPNKGMFLKLVWGINLLISLIALYKKYKINNGNIKFLSILTLGGFSCFWIGLSINYADRVGLIFLPAIMLLYNNMGMEISGIKRKKIYYNGFTLFYLFYFWYSTSIIESVSYKSIIG